MILLLVRLCVYVGCPMSNESAVRVPMARVVVVVDVAMGCSLAGDEVEVLSLQKLFAMVVRLSVVVVLPVDERMGP